MVSTAPHSRATLTPLFVLTQHLPEPAPEMLTAAGRLRYLERRADPAGALRAAAQEATVVCTQLSDVLDREFFTTAGPQLVAVCNYAAGYDNIDVPAATDNGVLVTNTPDVLTAATADCTMGLILAAGRRLCEGDAVMRAGNFPGWSPTYMLGADLDCATLALIGYGRIARAVAKRAVAFGMRIIYVNTGTDIDEVPGAERVGFDEALRRADVLSIHTPLTTSTRHLIGAAELKAMKPSAIVVNTARGPVIDEGALVRALQEGTIAAAGLDVYEREPLLSPGLAACPNVVLSPHLGSATRNTRAAMARVCAANAVAAAAGQIPPNTLNPDAR
jgi:glyoxylate reductase